MLSCLLKAGADVSLRDRGGDTALIAACRGGHANAVQLLASAGGRLEEVRLSQTKGAAVRTMVIKAYRAAGKDPDDADAPVPVGYARVQQRQSGRALGGGAPRRTPISGKLKKQLLREKRERRKLKQQGREAEQGREGGEEKEQGGASNEDESGSLEQRHEDDPAGAVAVVGGTDDAAKTIERESYQQTVQRVKKANKHSRGARGLQVQKHHQDLAGLPKTTEYLQLDTNAGAKPLSNTQRKAAKREARRRAREPSVLVG